MRAQRRSQDAIGASEDSEGSEEEEEEEEEEDTPPRSRPVSYYDNLKVGSTMPTGLGPASSLADLTTSGRSVSIGRTYRKDNARSSGDVAVGTRATKITGTLSSGNIGGEKALDRAPSMANCLSTTVPVNLAATQIAGRHAPTRSSLRHSRMIVQHRTGYRCQKGETGIFRNRRLAGCLAALQTILGVAVTFLSAWLLLWAPNLPVIDNPYWSGLPLLLSGTFGICLACCFKGDHGGFCLTSTKVTSAFLSMLATAVCLIACLAAAVHLARLTGLECAPARILNGSCLCRPRDERASPLVGSIRYADLDCAEVENVLTTLLAFSAGCNALGTIVAGCYGYLHWSARRPLSHHSHHSHQYRPVAPSR